MPLKQRFGGGLAEAAPTACTIRRAAMGSVEERGDVEGQATSSKGKSRRGSS